MVITRSGLDTSMPMPTTTPPTPCSTPTSTPTPTPTPTLTSSALSLLDSTLRHLDFNLVDEIASLVADKIIEPPHPSLFYKAIHMYGVQKTYGPDFYDPEGYASIPYYGEVLNQIYFTIPVLNSSLPIVLRITTNLEHHPTKANTLRAVMCHSILTNEIDNTTLEQSPVADSDWETLERFRQTKEVIMTLINQSNTRNKCFDNLYRYEDRL